MRYFALSSRSFASRAKLRHLLLVGNIDECISLPMTSKLSYLIYTDATLRQFGVA